MRIAVLAAVTLAALVIGTSFPFSQLLGQRQQLVAAQGQLDRLDAQNRALTTESTLLGTPGTEAAIARADYGFVQPGQKAYDILPTAGAPLTSAADSGHVPLEGPPVAPGSAQSQALLAAGAFGATSSPSPSTAPSGAHARHGGGSAQHSTLWGRVLRTLEFWR